MLRWDKDLNQSGFKKVGRIENNEKSDYFDLKNLQ